jgi:hypothetical protein
MSKEEKEYEEGIEEVISFLRDINKPISIAIRYWYLDSLRWLMKDYAKRKDKKLFEILESFIDVENVYCELKRVLDVIKPIGWALGKEIFDEINKICAKYDFLWGKLLFALTSENFEEAKNIADKLKEFKPELEKVLKQLEEKLRRV